MSPRPLHAVVALATALATFTAAATAVVVTAAPGYSAPDRSGQTITYRSTNPVNTDIDLGRPGFSTGNQQAFYDDAVRDGVRIGYEAGVCQIVLIRPPRLVSSCISTLVLSDGTLTSQFVFEEDLRAGPTGMTSAITGGTGRYDGASGTATGTFVPGTDDVLVVVQLR